MPTGRSSEGLHAKMPDTRRQLEIEVTRVDQELQGLFKTRTGRIIFLALLPIMMIFFIIETVAEALQVVGGWFSRRKKVE